MPADAAGLAACTSALRQPAARFALAKRTDYSTVRSGGAADGTALQGPGHRDTQSEGQERQASEGLTTDSVEKHQASKGRAITERQQQALAEESKDSSSQIDDIRSQLDTLQRAMVKAYTQMQQLEKSLAEAKQRLAVGEIAFAVELCIIQLCMEEKPSGVTDRQWDQQERQIKFTQLMKGEDRLAESGLTKHTEIEAQITAVFQSTVHIRNV